MKRILKIDRNMLMNPKSFSSFQYIFLIYRRSFQPKTFTQNGYFFLSQWWIFTNII